MPSSKKPAVPGRFPPRYLPALLLACGLAGAQAATLGPISVLSTLGEPLSAEIDIFDLSADEASELEVALASEMEFEKFGVTRSAQMESLKLRVVQQGRRRVIQLSTDQPLERPIYGLLLELRTENESTLGEFAVLPEDAVKPTEAAASSAPATEDKEHAAASSAASGASNAATSTPAVADSSSAEAPTVVANPAISETEEVAGKGAFNLAVYDAANMKQHTVQRGDSLTRIARQLSVPDNGLDQFITAVYQENPDAFIQQNLHYLKAGAVLTLPSEESISQIDEPSARKTIATQWQTFKSLLPAKDATSGDDSANRSSSRKLSTGSAPSAGASGDRLTLAALKPSETGGKTEEEAIAARKAAEEASERIRLLEKNILDLKSTVQPGKGDENSSQDSKETAGEASGWGVLASPARDLMMQAATVLLVAALVVASFLRRNAK